MCDASGNERKNSLRIRRIDMNAKLVTSIILASLTVIFIIQNAAMVEMKFLFWTLSISGALLVFLILSAGISLGWLLHGSFSRRKIRTHNNLGVLSGKRIH